MEHDVFTIEQAREKFVGENAGVVRCVYPPHSLECYSLTAAEAFFKRHQEPEEDPKPPLSDTYEYISPSVLRAKYQKYIEQAVFFPPFMREEAKKIISNGFGMIAESLGVLELTWRRTMAIEGEKQEKEKGQ